ncbi:MAG: hypothetical protein JOY63_14805, partial [Acetobacteraceae bacterium]|nr:hypothetical protein [Acetobacteraceae bacterium]
MPPRTLGPILGLLLCLPASAVLAQAAGSGTAVAPAAGPPRLAAPRQPVREAPPSKHGVKPAKTEAGKAARAAKPPPPAKPLAPAEHAAAEPAAKPA